MMMMTDSRSAAVPWPETHPVAARRRSTIRYDTTCYFNVRSKADMSRFNVPHGNDN